MNNIYQTTLIKPVIFKGIGLHYGKNSEVKVLPSNANTGITFKRVDLENRNIIQANYKNVSSTKLCTTLENSFGAKVSTVEHLLAALYLAGIDNALIEINSEEVPIMDGSAKEFLKIFKKSNVQILTEKRNFIKVLDKVELIDGERSISLEPNDDTLEIEFQLDYENKVIGKQKNIVNLHKQDISDISDSRTFCLFKDIEKIKKAGLAKGGSLDNAIVVDDHKVLNENGLRNDKEFVNHKILDLVGDFMLSGFRILGKVKCYQGGHQLTNMFLRKLLSTHVKKTNQKLEKFQISGKFNLGAPPKIAINA
jgi:UDP-3-O-[3-hydroxymyristoyl] N-acetylglucosamine deacetylase